MHRHIASRSTACLQATLLDRPAVKIAFKTIWSSTERVRYPEGSLLTANCLWRCLHFNTAMLKHLRHGCFVLGIVRGHTYAP